MLLPLTLLFFTWSSTVYAGSVSKGGNCTVAHNRLQTGTYQFWSDCDTQTYCNSQTNTCELKGCRRDDYPFGYSADAHLPDKCPKGQFCPDEEDACQPLLAVGSPCQLNRDDQCQAPDNFKDLADTSAHGLNFNGSVCLNSVCQYANVTLGLPCQVENTPYIGYSGSDEFIDIVSRGNCVIGLYCDAQQKVCVQTKNLGEGCDADKECASYNCMSSGVCGKAAEEPNHFGVWVYIIVAIGIFGGIFGTLAGLFITHRRQRDAEREKRIQYWREQNAFRQNIMNMRQSARDSILSLPRNVGGSNRSTMYSHEGVMSEESQAPMMAHQAIKSSGLRQQYYDDNSTEYDDGIVMSSHHQQRQDGRF